MCDPAAVFYLYNGDADDPAAALMRHLSSEHLVKSFSLFSHSFDGKSFNLSNLIGREKFSSGAEEEGTDDTEATGPPCTYYPEHRKRKSTKVKEEMKGEADDEEHTAVEVAIKSEPGEEDSDEEQHCASNVAVEIKDGGGGDVIKQDQDAEGNSPQQKRRALSQVRNIRSTGA